VETSCMVGSAGMRSPCGGLVRGELQRRTQRPCAASSRWAHAWQRPRISVAGLTLLGSGRATQMAWSWGWRCQDLEASMSVLVGVGRVSAAL
jgi:hypothetical protein